MREQELEEVLEVVGPRPDFFVRSRAGPFIAEVKAFREPRPLDRRSGRVFSVGVGEMLKRLSSAVDEVRCQLRAYRVAIPRVVVLDN